MAFTGSTKKYLELNTINGDECDLRARPDDLAGLNEITEEAFDVKCFNQTKLTEPTCKKIMLPMQ